MIKSSIQWIHVNVNACVYTNERISFKHLILNSSFLEKKLRAEMLRQSTQVGQAATSGHV